MRERWRNRDRQTDRERETDNKMAVHDQARIWSGRERNRERESERESLMKVIFKKVYLRKSNRQLQSSREEREKRHI